MAMAFSFLSHFVFFSDASEQVNGVAHTIAVLSNPSLASVRTALEVAIAFGINPYIGTWCDASTEWGLYCERRDYFFSRLGCILSSISCFLNCSS
jgi:hypothetical protein